MLAGVIVMSLLSLAVLAANAWLEASRLTGAKTGGEASQCFGWLIVCPLKKTNLCDVGGIPSSAVQPCLSHTHSHVDSVTVVCCFAHVSTHNCACYLPAAVHT